MLRASRIRYFTRLEAQTLPSRSKSSRISYKRNIIEHSLNLINFTQVNHSPSFHTDAQIDKNVKEELLMDTFDILNLQQCDKKKIIEEDKKRIRERLLQGISGKDSRLVQILYLIICIIYLFWSL